MQQTTISKSPRVEVRWMRLRGFAVLAIFISA